MGPCLPFLSFLPAGVETNIYLSVSVKMRLNIYINSTRNLEIAKTYATSHAERQQNRYASHYNLRSRDKHFDVREQVLILMPDNTSSRLFSKWMGPATVVDVRSPIQLNSTACDVICANFTCVLIQLHVILLLMILKNTCAVVYENDTDFGQLNICLSRVLLFCRVRKSIRRLLVI